MADKAQDDILSYREMCDIENVQVLQQGMNFRLKPGYSVILMSQRSNAPYNDLMHEDGITIEYEGHDAARSSKSPNRNPKDENQPDKLPSGRPTQNGLFIRSVEEYKHSGKSPEIVKAYEKILPGIWSFKGLFDLIDYAIVNDGKRNVYRFILRLSDEQISRLGRIERNPEHTRIIPSEIKKEVWKRDGGKCVICGDVKNLHFDHDLPFSKGGTSLTVGNVRLLCMKCNLAKSDKIE